MLDDPVPMHRLDVPAPQFLPFAIGSFDRIGPLSRAGFPHRHTFHEIVYVRQGRGSHVVDTRRWPLDPPHLAFVAPGQVHFWEGVRDLEGWVVLFTEDFLVVHPEDRDVLHELAELPWLCPGRSLAPALSGLVAEMEREYLGRAPDFVSVLQAYLHVLLVRARRLSRSAAPWTAPARPEEERARSITRRFNRLLGESGPAVAELSVRGCAAEVGISTGYLNEAVKRVTGRTPGQLIRQAQAREAKRLLATTELTVAQVARLAGFTDAAYFCRFFRRETGTSPGNFRRVTRADHHDHRVWSIDSPTAAE